MSDAPASWKQSGLIWWPLGVATLVLDQITKMLIHTRLALHEAIYVLPVLDILHARRIDHGVRCLEDDALVDRLVAEQIPLTVCPLSNVRLRVFDTMREHPLRKMLARGLKVTINSDDPAYFGGYVNENYLAVAEALDLTRSELEQLAKNSFEASFPS